MKVAKVCSQQDLRILFLTRRYPPSTGGVQTHCLQLFTHLSPLLKIKLIALGHSHLLHLGWFIPCTLVRALCELLFHRVDAIYFGDGVTSCLAPFLRPFSKARFVVTIHGLEMTYSQPLFSHLIKWGVACCQHVVVTGENTRKITIQAGVPEEKIDVVYMGIKPLVLPPERHQALKAAFEEKHGIRFGCDRILLNYGRQVQRKGLAAFAAKGVPLLERDIKFFIGGLGPEYEGLKRLREELGLQHRMILLGWLDDETTAMLRAEADLFLMPNIQVPNDVEGFGIAQLEGMYAGLPVVAFAVDALVESVREGGYLIPANDYRAFVDEIQAYLSLPSSDKEALREQARTYVRREYSWRDTTARYLRVIQGD